MNREEAIKYWEQFDAEIDELASDNLYEEQIDALEKQREVVEFTISALRQQETVTDSHQLNEPLTLDELRQMDGEPVWIHFIGGAVIRNDGWFIISQIGTSEIFLSGKVSVYKNFWYYGETWVAYRQKPEEGTV